MKNCVFVHTNHRQMVGALVSQYSLKRNSRNPDAFDVRIIHTKDHPFLHAREGQYYLRDGVQRQWLIEDLQSFTPLRFMPPELMGYQGRAVVIDPDVFAVGDVNGLLTRDMQGKALLCRARKGRKSFASSVMLLDCAKLTHWRTAEQFDEMFESKRDYMDWISLKLEPPESIGLLEPQWNDFDHLDENTKLLHNTKRWNQPWKTGLPVDFTPTEGSGVFRALGWIRRARAGLFGRYALLGQYKRHWDPNQENFFFGLLRECLEKGVISEAMLREEMERNHVRHDAFEVLERTPRLAA
ncbi:MAG TPA: hypothetical protein VFV80_07005 [Geminicoccaceae bacterium]|nr:hypothetical protein [Geminicoccaceae bacterium]